MPCARLEQAFSCARPRSDNSDTCLPLPLNHTEATRLSPSRYFADAKQALGKCKSQLHAAAVAKSIMTINCSDLHNNSSSYAQKIRHTLQRPQAIMLSTALSQASPCPMTSDWPLLHMSCMCVFEVADPQPILIDLSLGHCDKAYHSGFAAKSTNSLLYGSSFSSNVSSTLWQKGPA